jgi:hypothetical protein
MSGHEKGGRRGSTLFFLVFFCKIINCVAFWRAFYDECTQRSALPLESYTFFFTFSGKFSKDFFSFSGSTFHIMGKFANGARYVFHLKIIMINLI